MQEEMGRAIRRKTDRGDKFIRSINRYYGISPAFPARRAFGTTSWMEESEMNNILIVDDEEDILDLLSDVVKQWGHLPIVARDGVDALQKVQDVPIDLVLSDIRMPNMDGMSFLDKLRKGNSNLAVIFITGYPSIESAVSSMKDGAYDYLTKPINIDELKIRVDRGLERGRLAKSINFLKGANWSLIISIPIWLLLGIFLAKMLR